MRLLLDADAFIALRNLSLLTVLRTCVEVRMEMTEYIARHELAPLSGVLKALEDEHRLVIHAVSRGTEAFRLYRRLQLDGAHKGEAEAIAWAVNQEATPIFVSLDRRARKHAGLHRLLAVDIMDLAIHLVEQHIASFEEIRSRLLVWEEHKNASGCPADFTSLDETWRKRRDAWRLRGNPPS